MHTHKNTECIHKHFTTCIQINQMCNTKMHNGCSNVFNDFKVVINSVFSKPFAIISKQTK